MDLVQFLKVLYKRKIVLIAIPIIAIIVTFFLTRNLPDVYKSEAQLAAGLVDDNSDFLEKDKSDKESEISQKFSNLIELMKLKKIADAVSYKLILNDLTTSQPFRKPSKLYSEISQAARESAIRVYQSKLDSLESLFSGNNNEKGLIELLRNMGYDEETLSKKLKIERIGKSDFITVTFESENPELSAFVVNQLCDIFIKYYKQLNKDKRIAAISFFAKLAIEKKDDLDKKIARLRDYKIKNGIINLYEQTKSIDNMINNFEGQRELIVKNIPAYKSVLQDIDNKLSDKERSYIESKISPYNDKIVKLRDEIKVLSDEYIFTGNTNQSLQDSIIYKRYLLNEEVKKAADEFSFSPNIAKQDLVLKKLNYQIELDISENNVKSLDRTIQKFKAKFNSFTPLEGTVKAYESDVDVTSKEYLDILSKLNESNYKQYIEVNLKQVQLGGLNDPEPSKKMMLVILAGLVTFVISIVIIFVLEYFDLTIKTPKKFAKLTGLPILGCLNYVKSKKIDLKQIFTSSDTPLILETFKQLLRIIRYEIEISMNGKKFLLLTSMVEKEGKTFIATCIAYVFALSGKKVLLIDTNFKNNSITRNFSAKPLLEPYLKGKVEKNEVISKTAIHNVDVIGSEGGGYTPIEIAGEDVLKDKISALSEDYDLIILEGESINKYSSTKELMNISDNIISIFSANRVLGDSDYSSIAYLKLCKNIYIGSILNNIDLENLEQVFGEIEKNRSGVRRYLKRVVTRNLSGSKNKPAKETKEMDISAN